MKIIKSLIAVIVLSAAAFAAPDVLSTAINYSTNQITITGTGFSSADTATFGGSALTISSFTSTQLVATLPSVSNGTYRLVVTGGGGNTSGLSVTYIAPSSPAPPAIDGNGQMLGTLMYYDSTVSPPAPVFFVSSLQRLVEPTSISTPPNIFFPSSDCTGSGYINSFVNAFNISTMIWGYPTGGYMALNPVSGSPFNAPTSIGYNSTYSSAGCTVVSGSVSAFGPVTVDVVTLPFTTPIAGPVSIQ